MSKKKAPLTKEETGLAQDAAAYILGECVRISIETPDDVFVDFSPHVQWIEIGYHRGGWKSGFNGETMHIYLYPHADEYPWVEPILKYHLAKAKNDFDAFIKKQQEGASK